MPDAQQFEAFMKDYQNMVFSTAMRLVGNQSEAEDISQEVFLRAFEHFFELRESPTAGGWLKRVATNLSLNHLSRYRSRWQSFTDFFSPTSDREIEEQDFADDRDLVDEISRADRNAVVEACLHSLPQAQRVPLVLFHLENMSYHEIAARLKISLGKVKTDIFRAREALRKILVTRFKDEEWESSTGASTSGKTGQARGPTSQPTFRQSARL